MIALVLCGGQSTRMGSDKGLLQPNAKTWAATAADILAAQNLSVQFSVNPHQVEYYSQFFTATDLIVDDETLAVISREAKKRKDSIAQFTNGGRLDLVDIEEAELNILKEFLPVPMAHAEIIPIINAKIAQLNADKSKAGMVTGLVMKELKGKADGDDVKKLVDELLA